MTANRAQTRARPRAPARVAARKAAVNRGKRGKPTTTRKEERP